VDDRLDMPPKPRSVPPTPTVFDVQAFLKSARVSPRTVRFATGAVVFAQGAQANSVFYVQEGGIKLSVLSSARKEAVVAMLGPGDFLRGGSLVGQPLRMGTATAVMRTALLRIPKRDNQLFNSSEKRLARTLLLLARYGRENATHRVLPKLSQETLAEMVGNHALTRELLHEQVSQTRVDRIQRRAQGPQLAADHRPSRLIAISPVAATG